MFFFGQYCTMYGIFIYVMLIIISSLINLWKMLTEHIVIVIPTLSRGKLTGKLLYDVYVAHVAIMILGNKGWQEWLYLPQMSILGFQV